MEDVISRPAREALGDTTRRCTATNRAGERCGRAPIPGGFVCAMHGGKIPTVQKAARERLLALVEPALDVLLRMLRAAPPCEHCGRSDVDRDPVVLRAAQLVLDRTGFHPTLSVAVQQPRVAEHFAWIPTDRLAQMQEWIAEAKAAMQRGEPTAEEKDERTLDAVLVEEVPTPGEPPGEEDGLAPLGNRPNEPVT